MWQCCAPTILYDIGCRSTQGAMARCTLVRCEHCDMSTHVNHSVVEPVTRTHEAIQPFS